MYQWKEGGGGEVREGPADSSKGDARSRGVYVLGGGERTGATYKSSLFRTVGIPEDKVALMVRAPPEDLIVWPQKGREEQGVSRYKKSGRGNLFSIRTAGKLCIRSFVS